MQHRLPDAASIRWSGPTVLSAGFTVLDVVRGRDVISHHAGGTAGNVAADLAWLGVHTAALARLGADPAGELLRMDLESAGVDVRHVHLDESVITPIVVHDTGRGGRPKYLFSCPLCGRKFSSHRPVTAAQSAPFVAAPPSIFFFDRASAAALQIAAAARAAGGHVVFEPNGPGREALTRKAVDLATVVKVSIDRLDGLMELLGLPRSGQVQVRTAGADGLRWRFGASAWRHEEAFEVDAIVDQGGAGDWTTAGLLSVLPTWGQELNETVLRRGLRLGQALAAVSCAYTGARGMNTQASPEWIWEKVTGLLQADPGFRGPLAGLSHGVTEPAGCHACLADA